MKTYKLHHFKQNPSFHFALNFLLFVNTYILFHFRSFSTLFFGYFPTRYFYFENILYNLTEWLPVGNNHLVLTSLCKKHSVIFKHSENGTIHQYLKSKSQFYFDFLLWECLKVQIEILNGRVLLPMLPVVSGQFSHHLPQPRVWPPHPSPLNNLYIYHVRLIKMCK